MLTLENYIELYESGIIFESVNIKGFSKWCEKNIEVNKEAYDTAKTTAEGFDDKIKKILKQIYSDLGINDEEEENKNSDNKRNQSDGGIVKTGDEKSTDDANKNDDSTDEKLEEKLQQAETKEKVTIINMTKTISDKLQKNDIKSIALLLDAVSMKGEELLDTCLRVALNAGNLNIGWIIQTFLSGENLDGLMIFLSYAKCVFEGEDDNTIKDIIQFIGIEN